jgi:hypothetical protein
MASPHSGHAQRVRSSRCCSTHACRHVRHVDVSCQQLLVMRRSLNSLCSFDALHRMHVRSSNGVPRRELVRGLGGTTTDSRECVRLLVGEAMLDDSVLLLRECSEVGRISVGVRSCDAAVVGERPRLLLRRLALLREGGGLGGTPAQGAKGGRSDLSKLMPRGEC